MTTAAAPGRCWCVACQVSAAVALLETGRTAMALSVLRPLAESLQDAALASMTADEPETPVKRRNRQKGHQRPAKPAFQRVAEEIHEHVGRLGPQRVAELLGVRLCDLGSMMDGRIDAPKSAMQRLRKAEE
ncbi:MAG: hypothetical protein ACJ8H8_29825 [Geminicoccaceae bacterium]